MFARRSLQISFTVIFVIVYFIARPEPAGAAVTLVSFAATPGLDEVLLEWETATELDNAGFYIRRSTSQSGPFTRVSPFIPSKGDPLIGAFYLWVDDGVVNGTTYWYQLESLDLSQNSEFYGPVSATPGTINPTGSPTATRTVTPTGPTSTATATSPIPSVTTTPVSPAPTSTFSSAYPAPATSIATAVQLPTFTVLPGTAAPLPSVELPGASFSGTITLVPFPELTLTFPEGGIILPGTPTETPTPTAAAGDASESSWSPLGGVLLVVILVLIWVLLGTSFYFAFRRVS